MDSQVVTVDQFAAAMASIQEAIANLGQRIDGQQAQQVPVQEDTQFDTIVPPPPHSQLATQTVPFSLHSQTEVAPPPAIVPLPNRHITSPLAMKERKIKINITIIYNIMLITSKKILSGMMI
ncbi:hypothetical protein VitviT2T_018530 [Vitis vinifera]|uniref:Uncharacterized protein n=1 Tax=Vitis vinifera TaxID=29760 RepID=A0ABY9CY51_VITVI|nr:hypothetical protein VitviT2T_018530 [Vitis vinifera]